MFFWILVRQLIAHSNVKFSFLVFCISMTSNLFRKLCCLQKELTFRYLIFKMLSYSKLIFHELLICENGRSTWKLNFFTDFSVKEWGFYVKIELCAKIYKFPHRNILNISIVIFRLNIYPVRFMKPLRIYGLIRYVGNLGLCCF